MNEDLHNIMVDISCPHCGEDIEIEDGDYETYSCPTCDGDFEYREDGIYIKFGFKKGIEGNNQQDKVASLIKIDKLMEEKSELRKKQNIVNGFLVIGVIIALVPLFPLLQAMENRQIIENAEALILFSIVGWVISLLTFLFPYNERIKAINRKMKSERDEM